MQKIHTYLRINDFNLLDFFEDCNEFCFAHCCYFCYIYGIFKGMDENFFTWLLVPNPLIGLRIKIRAVLRIKGGLADDCCQSSMS